MVFLVLPVSTTGIPGFLLPALVFDQCPYVSSQGTREEDGVVRGLGAAGRSGNKHQRRLLGTARQPKRGGMEARNEH